MVSAEMREIVWKDVSRGIGDPDLQMVAVSPDNADIVYISSSNVVYKTADGGKKWDEVFSFRGMGNTINAIAITPTDTKIVYAGTDDGLYRSNDNGIKWEKIFSGIGDAERSILFIAVNPGDPDVIYIGTRAGLFLTGNKGRDWEKGRNLPSNTVVYYIAVDPSNPHIIYTATDKGLYKSLDSGAGWNRILKSNFTAEDIIEIETNEINEIAIEKKMSSVAIDPADSQTVYVGTFQGLLVSRDAGLTWEAAGSPGLISRNIRHIVINSTDADHLYAATGRGVFRYSKITKSWKELYKGIVTSNMRYLAFAPVARNGSPTFWAVTKRGVYKSMHVSTQQNIAPREDGIMKTEDAFSLFAHEPSIEEIRDAAVIYAEVHPDKIDKWRKAAAYKAWLPDLRFAYDKGKDWQNSYTYYKVDGQYEKFDDITEDRDKGWSISLTWELGDLIWNSAQTSIDTRSRLMVQLRDDILNEVTRLYFERRRLQIELIMSPTEDIKESIEKKLRLQELTANIDSLTGSYLSKRLSSELLF
jgi:photosystem II stability/assembly factor-like uncharacterized protein